MSWYLYLLENNFNKRTYLGVTTDYNRRLRQHNGELKGGAKYTSSFKEDGEWILKLIVKDLSKSEALSKERTIKNLRRKAKGKTPYEKRLYIIKQVIPEDNIIYLFLKKIYFNHILLLYCFVICIYIKINCFIIIYF